MFAVSFREIVSNYATATRSHAAAAKAESRRMFTKKEKGVVFITEFQFETKSSLKCLLVFLFTKKQLYFNHHPCDPEEQSSWSRL